jgi:hypothetical protein
MQLALSKLGELRVISAYIKAASLLTNFRTKKKKKTCVQLPKKTVVIKTSRKFLNVIRN